MHSRSKISLERGEGIASIIYNRRPGKHDVRSFGENSIPQGVNTAKESHTIMGDKSPKANHKKSGQKQSKANNAAQKKKSVATAKQAAGKKK